MSRRIPLGSLSQIPPGEGRTFEVDDRKLAVFRTRAGALFATQAACPHRGGPLADGLLGEATLICPLHDWCFDLTTGQPLQGDCAIDVYPVMHGPEQELWIELPGKRAADGGSERGG
jgi:nitrite reductase (NADH) small subunit